MSLGSFSHGIFLTLYSESVLTDTDFFLDNLDEKLFPGVSSDVQVHNGFGEAHAETAQAILAETNNLISSKGANQVLVVSIASTQSRTQPNLMMSIFNRSGTRSEARLQSLTPSSCP